MDSVRQKAGIQRVRIGLTGLASVFLAVLLAAVFTGRTRDEAPVVSNAAAPAGPGAAAQSPPEEPLATLGLTPSNPEFERRDSAGAERPARGRALTVRRTQIKCTDLSTGGAPPLQEGRAPNTTRDSLLVSGFPT